MQKWLGLCICIMIMQSDYAKWLCKVKANCGTIAVGRGSTVLALASSEGTGMRPLVGRAWKQSGRWTCRTSAWPLDVPQRRISWGCCRRMQWESRRALSKIRQGAWHRIFHITTLPWFLIIDEFNSIVFHPTKNITWRSIKNRMRGRNISCNNGFVVYLHFAD